MATARTRRRQRPPELKIVLDTNAIYTQSEYYLVKQEVSELIRDSSQHLDLAVIWYLPEVVRHERQYQMSKQSLDLLSSIQKLERILGHNLNITEDIVKRRIQEVIDQQIQELNIQTLTIEPANVDWNAIMLNAAYRRPPFSASEREKGFRDAIIAEAFLQLVSSSPVTVRICRIALITGDGLLAEAIQARTSDATNIRILPTIEELRGLINTLVSEVSEDFVESIRSKAKAYFFKPGDDITLFYREKIWPKIHEKFRKELSALPSGADEREHVSTNIGSPRFVRKEGQRVFWATRIIAKTKSYKYESSSVTAKPFLFETSAVSASPLFQGGTEVKFEPIHSLAVGKPQSGFAFPALTNEPLNLWASSRTKTLFKSGEIVFDITWSVGVTTARRTLSRPVIESIDYIETKWE